MLTVGYAVCMETPFIRMMAPTLTVGLVSVETHLQVAACHLPLYNLPNGQWANWFLVETLTSLWIGDIECRWNSEHPLVFQACIVCQVRGIDSFHDVMPIIWGQLNAWDAGRYLALVKAAKEANPDTGGGGGGMRMQQVDTTLIARKYHSMVLGSKVCTAVCMVTNRDGGRKLLRL
jgi:hypothetical protein